MDWIHHSFIQVKQRARLVLSGFFFCWSLSSPDGRPSMHLLRLQRPYPCPGPRAQAQTPPCARTCSKLHVQPLSTYHSSSRIHVDSTCVRPTTVNTASFNSPCFFLRVCRVNQIVVTFVIGEDKPPCLFDDITRHDILCILVEHINIQQLSKK